MGHLDTSQAAQDRNTLRKPSGTGRRVVDAHVHLYDSRENRYGHLEQPDEMFEALIGDYSSLPRRYLLDDYLADESGVQIDGLVWHEFISADPVREVRWAQRLADCLPVPMAIVGLVDFLAPDLDGTLDAYAQCANVAAVREHLGWDERNALRRFAKRTDLLSDVGWRQGLKRLNRTNFRCSLEVFSSQLGDLLPVLEANPEIGFTIAVMGWPIAVEQAEFGRWQQSMAAIAACENVRVIVSAVECVFGMRWRVAQVQSWIDTVFELFGTERVMFGSHRPISRLAQSFPSPYDAYQRMTNSLSETEHDAVFRLNAASWFFGALQGRHVRVP